MPENPEHDSVDEETGSLADTEAEITELDKAETESSLADTEAELGPLQEAELDYEEQDD